MIKEQNIIESFNCAIEGFIYVVKTQRNMRIHFLIAVFILLLAIYLNFKGTEILLLCGAIAFVLLAEMLNTAMELTVDLISERYHPLARIAKDITAGAVLISAINAIITGYLLFSQHLTFSFESGLLKIKQSSWHMTFICLILVLAAVVMAKVIFHKGTPLRGGMPSGHAAVAFSMWTIISILANNGLITVLAFVMAFLIARSRLKEAIHTVWEVVTGGFVGVILTLLVFQVLGW